MLTLIPILNQDISEILDSLLKTEEQFSPALRTGHADLIDIITDGFSFIITLDGDYIGNILAAPITTKELANFGISFPSAKAIYMYSIALDLPHQRKGYGKQALQLFRDAIRAAGYTLLVGHFKEGASSTLAISQGWVVHLWAENWEQSGERFACCTYNLTPEAY